MATTILSEIKAHVALNTEVALIKVEIHQRKKEKEATLTIHRDDIHLRYHRLLMLPPTPTLTIGAIHSLVCQNFKELKKYFWGDPFSGEVAQAKRKQIAFELANSETSLIKIVEAANSDIREFDRQLDAINGIFKKLAASLPFSLDIVGIVARYGI